MTTHETKIELLSIRLLPFYFGEGVRLLNYRHADQKLLLEFSAPELQEFLKWRTLPINVLKPVRTNEIVPDGALRLGRSLDNLIGSSKLKNLVKLPLNQRLWRKVWFSSSVYSIDTYWADDNQLMVKLTAVIPIHLPGFKTDYINHFIWFLREFLEGSEEVLTYNMASPSKWCCRWFLEVRVLI